MYTTQTVVKSFKTISFSMNKDFYGLFMKKSIIVALGQIAIQINWISFSKLF